MSGISASVIPFMNSASVPEGTTCTPVAEFSGRGFACSTASFAISFDVPPPMEIEMPVSRTTSALMRVAVTASASLW